MSIMNPQDPASFNHRTERLSTGRTYHFVDQVPQGYHSSRVPTLLCVHGFPDLWYGWRYQIGPWTRKGLRVVVPDMLGYGGTDKPIDPSEYSTQKLCNDLAALLDLLGVERAIVIGHDWGSFVSGRFALWYPSRLSALIMLSVPYTPPSPDYIPVEEVAKRVPNLGYQVYFADERSTTEIESNLEMFLGLLFQPPDVGQQTRFTHPGELSKLLSTQTKARSILLNSNELQYYHQEFRKGMLGPLSYYRTAKFRHEEELAARLPSVLGQDLPVLFLWGTKDPTATPVQIDRAKKFVPRLQDMAVEGRGHWIMIESRDDVTNKIVEWLEGLVPNHQSHSKL